ncbi:unnamed protein product [Camellia sinensis]
MFKADLPGLKKEEVTFEIEEDDRVLQINGERNFEDERNDTWHRVERSSGRFTRPFRLPENAKMDEVMASMENGVLTVTVPKVELTTNLLDIILPISISTLEDATGINPPQFCMFRSSIGTELMRYKLMNFKLLEKVINMRRLTLPLTGGTTTLFLPVVKFAIFDSFSTLILFPMHMYMYID